MRRRGGERDTVYTCNFQGTVGTDWEPMSGSKGARKEGSSTTAWDIGTGTVEGVTASSVAQWMRTCWCPKPLYKKN